MQSAWRTGPKQDTEPVEIVGGGAGIHHLDGTAGQYKGDRQMDPERPQFDQFLFNGPSRVLAPGIKRTPSSS
jgi:hypothetical protein